jgi:hypothetical protein
LLMKPNQLRHGYGHDDESRPHGEIEGSLAYHLRRHRQGYGERGISQRALAMIANVSRSCVSGLELAPDLQVSVETVLRVALALRQPVESLVSPARLTTMCTEIERRRKLLGGTATLPDASPSAGAPQLALAVTYRTPHLLVALADGTKVLEIHKHRIGQGGAERICTLIEEHIRAYSVREIIVEAGSRTSDCVLSLGIPHREISFRAAKAFVSAVEPPPTNDAYYPSLVASHPDLRRYVKTLPATGRVATSERWRTARLVAATLALAASAATAPPPRAPKRDACGPEDPRRRLSA